MTTQFSQQGQNFEFDVIVIGTGLAGMHYALQLLKLNPHVKIALLSKVSATECNSYYAQGGIAAIAVPEDSFAAHIQDTINASDGLAYQTAVECIIRQGPEVIQQLRNYQV